jgi:HlyD family secretion protein
MTNFVARTGDSVRRHPLWSAALGLAVLGVAGLFWWQSRARNLQYVTASVTRGNIQRSVSATGALNPLVTVQVGSYVSGQVKSLGCDYNTEVVVGQVCATIDPVHLQVRVDEDN